MSIQTDPGPEARRRSRRVVLSIPVTVSGEAGPVPFSEDTRTLVINAHGALLALAQSVSYGQTVVLATRPNSGKQSCSVVYLGPATDGKMQVGVEFTEPAPHFWPVTFPPEDWARIEDPVSPAPAKQD